MCLLFQVQDLRHVENHVLQEEACSEQGSAVGHPDPARRAPAPPLAGAAPGHQDIYSFNLSFEELSNVGLEEPPRLANPPWTVSAPCFTASASAEIYNIPNIVYIHALCVI